MPYPYDDYDPVTGKPRSRAQMGFAPPPVDPSMDGMQSMSATRPSRGLLEARVGHQVGGHRPRQENGPSFAGGGSGVNAPNPITDAMNASTRNVNRQFHQERSGDNLPWGADGQSFADLYNGRQSGSPQKSAEPLGGATGEWRLEAFRGLSGKSSSSGGAGKPAPAAPAGPPSNLWTPEKDTRDPSISAYDTPMEFWDGSGNPNDLRMTAGTDMGLRPLAADDPSAYAERGEKPDRGFLQSLGDWGNEVMYGADKYVKEHQNLGELGLKFMAAAYAPTKQEQFLGAAEGVGQYNKANRADDDRKLAMEDRQEAKDDRKQRLIDDDLNRKQLAAERTIFAKDQVRKDKYIASFDASSAALEKRLADPALSKKDRDALMEERGFMQLGPEMWSQWKMEMTKQAGITAHDEMTLKRAEASQAAAEGRAASQRNVEIMKSYLASDRDDLSAANTVKSNGVVAMQQMQSLLDTVMNGEDELNPIAPGLEKDLKSYFNEDLRSNFDQWKAKSVMAAREALRATGAVTQGEIELFADSMGGVNNTREGARKLIVDQMNVLKTKMQQADDLLQFHDKSGMGFTNPDAKADGKTWYQWKGEKEAERAKALGARLTEQAKDPAVQLGEIFTQAKKVSEQELVAVQAQARKELMAKGRSEAAANEEIKAGMQKAGLVPMPSTRTLSRSGSAH